MATTLAQGWEHCCCLHPEYLVEWSLVPAEDTAAGAPYSVECGRIFWDVRGLSEDTVAERGVKANCSV